MPDCDDLIDGLHQQSRDQLCLALRADEPPVAAMHIDLAMFTEEQARAAEEMCEEN